MHITPLETKVALFSSSCQYIDDVLALVKCNHYVEWNLNAIPFSLSAERMSYICDIIKTHGEVRFHLPYEFWDIGANDKVIYTDSFNYYCRLFSAIKSLRLSVAVLHIGTTTGADEETALRGLKQLAKIARKQGIKLCLETLIHGLSSDMKFVKRCMEIDGLFLCLDTGHVEVLRRERGNNVLEEITSIKDKIFHAHLYDYEDEHMNHIPFTTESIKTNVWIPLLQTTNCSWFTMELDAQDDQERQKKLVEEYLLKK